MSVWLSASWLLCYLCRLPGLVVSSLWILAAACICGSQSGTPLAVLAQFYPSMLDSDPGSCERPAGGLQPQLTGVLKFIPCAHAYVEASCPGCEEDASRTSRKINLLALEWDSGLGLATMELRSFQLGDLPRGALAPGSLVLSFPGTLPIFLYDSSARG